MRLNCETLSCNRHIQIAVQSPDASNGNLFQSCAKIADLIFVYVIAISKITDVKGSKEQESQYQMRGKCEHYSFIYFALR